ncbi:hypothetical protein A1O7_00677 [Cladophialophora yegresii CBS 114405]|uniref:Sec39 domain-containing protein n=1 Tax=Cladophialophora yegresii CBS 114405 TaxID=1182544 RepID=W9WID1_9EURO|nr:uncharacterized protein A1O7_00677 [Cladophialophora yegresii CBS 114405]EXJ64341.1 hypothetical protein A1O7_00677 [Cladophialophora yegresii CBS 114405]
MKSSEKPSEAHIVLHAVQATSEGDLDTLLQLVRWRPDVLARDLTYRLVLSFYPADTSEAAPIVAFLKSLGVPSEPPESPGNPSLDSSISSLSRSEASRQCRILSLRALAEHASIHTKSELANFVIEWARRLEELHGAIQPAAEFVEQFVKDDVDLRLWYETYLVPLLRLQYEFYPGAYNVVDLEKIENLSGAEGISTLLQYAEGQQNPSVLARDLDQVVSPWVNGANRAKRRRLEHQPEEDSSEEVSWEPVYAWLISLSVNRFDVAAKAYVEWTGPARSSQSGDEAAGYAQTGLAIIYGCREASTDAYAICGQVLGKAAGLVGLLQVELSHSEPEISLPENTTKGLNETDLLHHSLLKKTNGFTRPSETSILLLAGLLTTARILSGYGLAWTIADLARTCVFGSERRHKDELHRLLQHIPLQRRRAIDWRSVRQQILYLHSWSANQQTDGREGLAFLSRLSLDVVETQILDALLKAAQYSLVQEIYLTSASPPLSSSEVHSRVVAAIYEAYDNASNGNRDRGGMKRANDILKVFRPNFPQSSTLTGIDYLIKATHSLSFYQLTLQHGVPFKPVAIRVQKDPLTLLEKVLAQDARAYTKLDDLLEIARSLVRAHISDRGNMVDDSEPIELRTLLAEQRVTYAAIMAALAMNDFDTAYAYVTTRLHTSPEQSTAGVFTDDTSWRAAYAAGKYRPSASPKSLNARIDSLAQRMELLSRALLLAPSGEALSGILATWRRYEEELDGLKTQAVEEERVFDAKADASLPGAFGIEDREADVAETKRVMARRSGPAGSGPSYEEEAPMGLFDVARGAASALRKSAAFPLGANGLRDLKISSASNPQDLQREQASSPTSDDGRRLRKRDMVANMVGSGLGWVLGAQPQDRVDYGG